MTAKERVAEDQGLVDLAKRHAQLTHENHTQAAKLHAAELVAQQAKWLVYWADEYLGNPHGEGVRDSLHKAMTETRHQIRLMEGANG